MRLLSSARGAEGASGLSDVAEAHELVPLVRDLGTVFFRVRLDEIADSLQQGLEAFRSGPHGGDPESRALEEVLVRDLGRRDLEVAAKPGFQRPQEGAFLLEAPAPGEMKLVNRDGDDHGCLRSAIRRAPR